MKFLTMAKLWRSLAALGVLALQFWPVFERALPLPEVVRVILLIMILTYGISLLFSSKLPAFLRFGAAYLTFVGLSYFVAGILGLMPHSGLIEAWIWDSLISPFPLISFLDQLIHRFPYTASRAPYYTAPVDEHHFLFSATVVAVSIIAIVAACAMAKSHRTAYRVWLVLLSLSIVSLVGYLVVGFVSWGPKETIIPLCWEVSYITAFVLARSRCDLGSHPSQ
jgi:hypothetical protein